LIYIKINKKMIGIYITSYQKANRESIELLKRSIGSVINQTNKKYKLYVILDSYNDEDQINEIKTILPPNSFLYNMEYSYSDINYPNDNHKKWCVGGLTATIYAIEKILSDGISWVCRLDHDDWWSDDHIELLHENIDKLSIDYMFLTTKGVLGNRILPDIDKKGDYYPKPSALFHSTSCIKFSDIPIRYEDPFKNGGHAPADAWLWGRLSKYMKDNSLKGLCIPKITLFREREGDMKMNK